MQRISYLEAMAETAGRLANGGVFLNVGGEQPNTMTIGWGWMGPCWRKNVFVVLVRPQRHTHDLLKQAGEFTISVPTRAPLREQLAFAGTKSGRDVDKFSGHGLTAVPAQRVNAPIIAECGLHFECRTLMVQEMTGETLAQEVLQYAYPERDFHTMFFGEIVDCYRTDE